jgi:hypothetical protein
MVRGTALKVACGAVVVAAVAVVAVLRSRRARRQRRDAEAVVPLPAGLFRSCGNESSSSHVTVGEPVHYSHRIATFPLRGVEGASSCFIVVDDVSHASAALLATLAASGADLVPFMAVYTQECRFLSDSQREAVHSAPLDNSGVFTTLLTYRDFVAAVAVDREHGIVATLVVMGAVSADASLDIVRRVGRTLAYSPPLDGVSRSGGTLEVTIPATSPTSGAYRVQLPPTAVVSSEQSVAAVVAAVHAARGNAIDRTIAVTVGLPSVSGEDVRVTELGAEGALEGGFRRVYTNTNLGVRFEVAKGGRVFPHRLEAVADRVTTVSALTYVLDAAHANSVVITISSTHIPADAVHDDCLLTQTLALACADMTRRDSPTIAALSDKRAAVVDIEARRTDAEQRLCRVYLCPRKGLPNGSNALVLRCEGDAHGGTQLNATLASFLDAFFFLGTRV